MDSLEFCCKAEQRNGATREIGIKKRTLFEDTEFVKGTRLDSEVSPSLRTWQAIW